MDLGPLSSVEGATPIGSRLDVAMSDKGLVFWSAQRPGHPTCEISLEGIPHNRSGQHKIKKLAGLKPGDG